MGQIRDLFCKFETYLGKFNTYFDNSRLMRYFYKFEIYRVKIRILLNTKGTYERIFKYFNANGDEKNLILAVWILPKHV